jgi:hypothetical protein
MLVDPESVVSILPLGFAYDLPWILGAYNDLTCFKQSYGLYSDRIAHFPLVLDWHRKHLLYLLLSMSEHKSLAREDLLEMDEVPAYIHGYDWPLPADTLENIERDVVPFVANRYPTLMPALRMWLDGRMDAALAQLPDRRIGEGLSGRSLLGQVKASAPAGSGRWGRPSVSAAQS